MSNNETGHRNLARIFADFLGLTAAVQTANATQLESLQAQIDALNREIDAHPEVSTNTSITAATVLANAAAQPPETAVAADPAPGESAEAAPDAAPAADPALGADATATQPDASAS